jgi:hypothetical protein
MSDGEGAEKPCEFDKFAGRPLSHVPVLRGASASMANVNLDARRAAPKAGRSPAFGVRIWEAPHNPLLFASPIFTNAPIS